RFLAGNQGAAKDKQQQQWQENRGQVENIKGNVQQPESQGDKTDAAQGQPGRFAAAPQALEQETTGKADNGHHLQLRYICRHGKMYQQGIENYQREWHIPAGGQPRWLLM